VIFDLDETLIHCNENPNMPYDIKLPIKFPTGEIIYAGVNIRPYAVELLKEISKNFEVIIFTASHSCYANVVLNYLDPDNKYISHRLFREHCFYTDKLYVKDLKVLNRDLS
jgi:CTD small phosphatase-like protein 2